VQDKPEQVTRESRLHKEGQTWQVPWPRTSSVRSRGPASDFFLSALGGKSGPIAAIRHADALGCMWGGCLVLSTSDDSCDDPSPSRSSPPCPWCITQILPRMMMMIRASMFLPRRLNLPPHLPRSASIVTLGMLCHRFRQPFTISTRPMPASALATTQAYTADGNGLYLTSRASGLVMST
jgi:hypothetical protein